MGSGTACPAPRSPRAAPRARRAPRRARRGGPALHGFAILLGIVLVVAVDARAAAAWFGAGIIGIPRGWEIELVDLVAELRPEPTNPYDPNAVMVIISGWHVGYLPKEEAARYHVPLARLVAVGVTPVAKARLWATTRREYSGAGTKSHSRITLALGAPERLAPLN